MLADQSGASVRVEDIAVLGDTGPAPNKIRRSSGDIAVTDALTDEETIAAIAAGRRIADEEVDSGADLLIAGDMGIGNTTPAAVLIGALTETEPVLVVGRGTGIDDNAWMRKAAAVRDGMYRARPHTGNPKALLRTAAGADIAAMAGFLAQAAVRRTPVILDGVVVTAAALVANDLAPGAVNWWVAGHLSPEPAHALALRRLDLEPLLDLGLRLGEGSGAALALPLVRSAVAALRDMATFDAAGVSGADVLFVALSWMTVLPTPGSPREFTRADGARIIRLVPITGAVVGAAVAALAWVAHAAGLPAVLVGALAIGGAALFTRGMHLDGFADCVDGLGSYGSPERAREIMRQGTVGPFGAAALVLLLLGEAAAVGALAGRGQWLAIGVAVGAARVAAVLGCRRGWAPSNPDGFGALTAGTQGVLAQVFWCVLALAAAAPTVPGTPGRARSPWP
ncbi:hypothetical protein MTP03_30610 [Tsukamurella sp. PLM1]|nr:hypothetical protein MTP03_30610 [Tsukamurella sp. PLM1]